MSLAAQILAALEAASNPVQEVRQQGEAQLVQLRTNAQAYFSACAEILVSPSANLHGRQLVGFQLKNNMHLPACSGNPNLQAAVCGQAVVDPQRNIRKVACSIVSLAVRENLWPVEPVVQNLTQMLMQRHGELPAVHGAMRALSQIVDDCIYLLDMRQLTGTVVQAVQPYLTSSHLGTSEEATEVRSKAFDVLATVLEQAGMDANSFSFQSLQKCILALMEACFTTLQAPPSAVIASKCVECLVLSLSFHTQINDALFSQLLQLMFKAMTSPPAGTDEQLRIAATEFFSALLNFPHFAELAEPAMPEVIPVLIRDMVYSDMEMGMLQANANDWNVPDKIDDIRPRHYQGRVQATNDDDEDDQDDQDEVEEWNLRRVSARTLDSISEFYGDRILTPVLTVINAMMQPNQPWKELEAAILALGAICDGCFDSLTPYLPSIASRLLELLKGPQTHFLVVSITLWTCTQIGRFIVNDPASLQVLVPSILGKMQNPSKMVQESATAALENIVELCDEGQLNAAAPAIIQTVSECMRGYQLKNRVLLFEVLETICEVLGEALRENPAAVEVLMAPLGEVWNSTPNDSPLLFSFFTCMGRVCAALGPAMQPMGKDIFTRAFGLLQHHMQLRFAAANSREDPPEPEFIITSADLLSGLFDALGSSLEPLVAEVGPAFMEVVLAMLMDESAELRQSGFSLTGDIAKACAVHIQRALPAFCDAALRNVSELNENTYGVISNVAWSLCNLLENQMDINDLPTLQSLPTMPQLFSGLAAVLAHPELTADMRNMADNVSLCLGLMLYVDPDIEERSGVSVAVFARRFCEYVRNMKSLPQKEMAITGFLLAVQRQPQIVVEHLLLFFDLACSVATEGPELQRGMKQLLGQAKSMAGRLWQERYAAYNEQLRAKLYQVYGLN